MTLANLLAKYSERRARGNRALFNCGQFLTGLLGFMALGAMTLPVATAADLAEIRERGYIIVGVKDNLRPLGFRNAAGQLEGLEIDLARQIAQDILGNAEAITLQPLTNSNRIPALLADEVDLVIARVTATPSRARLVDFSTPYYLDGTTFIARSALTLKDLQQQSIAVLNGSETIAVVRSRFPQARLVGVDSYEAAQELLEANQVSAFAADATVLTGWVQEFPQYYLLPQLVSTAALAVAMPRGLQYEDLRQRVNGAIINWQAQGFLRQSILNWGLPAEGIPALRINLGQETPQRTELAPNL
ncbi:MAG: transporter substrate-binding domain-containing protein [Timaviella obliquedivisa GSE-PSE-MK23-08B]|jgi:polar amino acid transport system substrate-binding protein|nr:transporter substrate-binding domain-containing protein [Timaviella obliquedivisa GSE-PSE-MK23-08B]